MSKFEFPVSKKGEGNNDSTVLDEIPRGTFLAEMTDVQIAAIRHSLEIGREIQIRFPDVADDYRNGMTLEGIVRKYKINEIFGIKNTSTANMVVYSALRGYDGKLEQVTDVKEYSGLIDEKILQQLAAEHRIQGVRKQMIEKKGIHAQSHEERKEVGRLGAQKQGSMPYTEEEITLIMELVKQPEYQRGSRINAKKISDELNKKFYGGESKRNPRQVIKMYSLFKKR